MRVCLVSIHPRLVSGQINSLVGLARALRGRGHEIRLVTAFSQDHLFDRDRMELPEANAGFLAEKLMRLPDILWRLRQVANESDIVQLNLPSPSFGLVGDVVQELLGRPIVVGFETHLPAIRDILSRRIFAAPGFYVPLVTANNRGIARLSGFTAARYVIASLFQASELASLGVPVERMTVIPNVVDAQHISGDFADLNGVWPRDSPTISYVGHFNHVKGVDVLIRALPFVLEKYPRARLVLAWSGLGPIDPIQRAIQAAGVADHVQILGKLPLGGIFRRSQVLALPYRMTSGQATFPSLLLEAMSVGVPLVTSDLPLLHELLSDGDTAELAQPGVASDVGRRIINLLDNPRYGRTMAENQRRRSRQRYHPEILASRYEAMYERIAEKGRSRREARILSEPARSGRV